LIERFEKIIEGKEPLNPRTEVIRISEIHPVYVNIDTPPARFKKVLQANPDFEACERFKARCRPVAFFPGELENNLPLNAFPIYLVIPWNNAGPLELLQRMRGLVLFNRVVGPDRIIGPCFDNEYGQWGAVLLRDETALLNFPYMDRDRSLKIALGKNWRDIGWLRSLLMSNEVILYNLIDQI
jgi:hypothetical protein